MTAEVSHGRGGAGNLAVDDTKYVDGEVVRTGVEGSHGDGAYSSGRGGAGNIGDVGTKATTRKDADVVPESAVRQSIDNRPYHTGRGGAGNEEKPDEAEGKTSEEKPKHVLIAHTSVADQLKNRILSVFKK